MEIQINNFPVFVEGKKENQPVVFVHGYPYDHLMWEEQIKTLSKDFYCVSYDIRGLGKSPVGDGQFTIEMFVDDLEIILNELKLNKPVLCGLSMGGYVSLRAAERMPDRFNKLILCDTKSSADDNAGKIKRAEGIKKINQKGKDVFVEDYVRNCFADSFVENNIYEKVLNRSKQTTAEGLKGCLLAMAGRTDTTNSLSQINIPTLVICGSEDKLTPPFVMKEMAEKINNSEFVVVEGAGHMAPVERAEFVTSTIKAFLSEK